MEGRTRVTMREAAEEGARPGASFGTGSVIFANGSRVGHRGTRSVGKNMAIAEGGGVGSGFGVGRGGELIVTHERSLLGVGFKGHSCLVLWERVEWSRWCFFGMKAERERERDRDRERETEIRRVKQISGAARSFCNDSSNLVHNRRGCVL